MESYIPSYSSYYYQNVKQLEHKTHDLRITFAKNYYKNLKEKGVSYLYKQDREAFGLYSHCPF